VAKEMKFIWEECKKSLDELQEEKEREIIEVTEGIITRKLEQISEAKIEKETKLEMYRGTPEEGNIL
jgi:ribosomal protein S13